MELRKVCVIQTKLFVVNRMKSISEDEEGGTTENTPRLTNRQPFTQFKEGSAQMIQKMSSKPFVTEDTINGKVPGRLETTYHTFTQPVNPQAEHTYV